MKYEIEYFDGKDWKLSPERTCGTRLQAEAKGNRMVEASKFAEECEQMSGKFPHFEAYRVNEVEGDFVEEPQTELIKELLSGEETAEGLSCADHEL